MFNSPALDVAIGLVLCFASVALMASTANEAIASALGWRSKTLLEGVKTLLNDPGFNDLALAVYKHALVHPLGDGDLKPGTATADVVDKPSYIEPQHFAIALIEHLEQVPGDMARLKDSVDKITDPQIKKALQGMVARANGDADELRNSVAEWFDRSMDRVSGVYKRYTQRTTFLLGLLLALAMNIDAINLAQELWRQHAEVSQVDIQKVDPGSYKPAEVYNSLMTLPIGWPAKQPIAIDLLGVVIAASAAMFGAPFWFDLLQRLVQLRSTGPKPSNQAKKKASV